MLEPADEKAARDWLADLQGGNWPRGRHVATRQAKTLQRVLDRHQRAVDAHWEFYIDHIG